MPLFSCLFRTAFFTIHGDVEQEERLLEDSRKTFEVCSGSKMATITGLETCMEFQFINASMVDSAPYFPLTGPFSFGLNVYKRDTHTSYKLLAKRTESKSMSVAQIAFHTPSSNVDRTVSFDLTMNYKQKEMEVSLVTPWKKVKFTGKQYKSVSTILGY
ncbi:uncharacterized protein LOC121389318 [Gigantopelta aegis]|uniref:uncharacterized protein LOC121389318 n=1 Tax=Gigantopelta aegis TaxID=1735272 RepID=UPI001B887BE8|nr:uncharacterized protein LOC121389318 [Gigantopelta aegis]